MSEDSFGETLSPGAGSLEIIVIRPGVFLSVVAGGHNCQGLKRINSVTIIMHWFEFYKQTEEKISLKTDITTLYWLTTSYIVQSVIKK